MHRIRQVGVILLVGGTLAGAAVAATSGTNLALVAYSTPKAAYSQLIPAFQKTAAGKDVSFSQSYGASGTQSQLILRGLKADVAMFSLYPDMQRLVKPGIVAANWNKDKYHGMVTDSVVVLSVRPGNPKHIKSWNDLTKPGVEVITPNPFTSGGARWNVMAAYGAQLKAGKSSKQGYDYMVKLFKNVSVQDKSARESLNTFAERQGRRPHRLRERGHLREEERGSAPVHRPELDDPDREPARGSEERSIAGEGVREMAEDAAGAEDLGRERLSPRRAERPQASQVSEAGQALQDRLRRGVERGLEEVVRPAERSDVEGRARGSAWLNQSQSVPPSPHGGGAASRLRNRGGHGLPVRDRPPPARGLSGRPTKEASPAFGRRSPRRRRSRRSSSRSSSPSSSP